MTGLGRMIGRSAPVSPTSAAPADAQWHAWDEAPWDHPFLTADNLAAMCRFSEDMVAGLERRLEESVPAHRVEALRFAFTGNMANNIYQRLRALSRSGTTPDLIQNPQDTSLMSDPQWEEFDGVASDTDGQLDDRVFRDGRVHPLTGRVLHPGQISDWSERLNALRRTYRPEDVERWPDFFSLLPMLECLRSYDAVFGMQVPFVPYLANIPYLLCQSGSDIRISANRGDSYGELHRVAFRTATAILASNPWTIAHARRLGLRNVIKLPAMIDETVYLPGPPVLREQWRRRVGGEFFVLSTTRLNDEVKGTSMALRGFMRFAQQVPGARLVIVEWGQQGDLARKLLTEDGLAERTVFLPLSGKRRLISYLQSADCLLDQFVLKQLGSTAREAMACGLPVVMRANVAHYDAYFDGRIPVLDAEGEEQIAGALKRLHDEPEFRATLAAQVRQWFLDNFSGRRWAGAYRTVLSASALGLPFDFSTSPLQQALGDAEKDHHHRGLANAPPHP